MSEATRPMLDLTVTRSQLTAGLKAANLVVPRKCTLPVLSHVRLDATNRLEITGTDLYTCYTTAVHASVSQPGSMVVPSHALADLIKSIPAKQAVRLTEVEKVEGKTTHISLTVTSGTMICSVPALPVSEFPAPSFDQINSQPIEVSGANLAEILARTGPFASTEEGRPILNGVLLEIGCLNGREPLMRAVATNGHRLSMAEVVAPVIAMPETPWSFILPGVAVDVLAKLPEVVSLTWDVKKPVKRATDSYIPAPDWLRVSGEGFTLTTRLIEGPYPHYQQVIPRDDSYKGGNDKVAVFDKRELAAVLGRMKAIASKQTSRIRVSLNGHCDISANTPDTGTVTERVQADYQGAPLEIGFNASYLSDQLKVIPTDRVRLTFSQPERAATIEPVDDPSALNHLMLLMPLRLVD